MKGISEREVFAPSFRQVMQFAEYVVGELPTFWFHSEGTYKGRNQPMAPDEGTPIASALPPELRCHELARAVASSLAWWRERRPHDALLMHGVDVRVVDGAYGAVDHSWLVLFKPDLTEAALLDVYAIGRLPAVQLVCPTAATIPEIRMYRPRGERPDINHELVGALSNHAKRIAAGWSP